VDELCNIIRNGCTLLDFKNASKEFHIKTADDKEEMKAGDTSSRAYAENNHQEIDNEFFSIIGTQGWGIIHAACSSNNTEIVEYLINKRRVNPNLQGKD
jgi:hypothetical protein